MYKIELVGILLNRYDRSSDTTTLGKISVKTNEFKQVKGKMKKPSDFISAIHRINDNNRIKDKLKISDGFRPRVTYITYPRQHIVLLILKQPLENQYRTYHLWYKISMAH